jgi:nitrite reductase (NADH) large subunit
MARHVATYRCEWRATLEDPDQLARFRHFVNADAPDPTLDYVRERGQRRPLRPHDARPDRVPVSIGTPQRGAKPR